MDWKNSKPPASRFQNTRLEASDDLNEGLGGLQDVDIEDDPPAPDSNLDRDNSVSPLLLSSVSQFSNAMHLRWSWN